MDDKLASFFGAVGSHWSPELLLPMVGQHFFERTLGRLLGIGAAVEVDANASLVIFPFLRIIDALSVGFSFLPNGIDSLLVACRPLFSLKPSVVSDE